MLLSLILFHLWVLETHNEVLFIPFFVCISYIYRMLILSFFVIGRQSCEHCGCRFDICCALPSSKSTQQSSCWETAFKSFDFARNTHYGKLLWSGNFFPMLHCLDCIVLAKCHLVILYSDYCNDYCFFTQISVKY